jgi:hypothetical protein
VPLTKKGEEIMKEMKKQYGEKKGEEVFYASANKGTIAGVHNKDQASDPGVLPDTPPNDPAKTAPGNAPQGSTWGGLPDVMTHEDMRQAAGRYGANIAGRALPPKG